MEFWPARKWRAIISIDQSDTKEEVVLDLPFALIGSHPTCSIRLRGKRVPPFAYVAFSFEDAIEVWPLSAVAFARWGVLPAGQELHLGRELVSFLPAGQLDASAKNPWKTKVFSGSENVTTTVRIVCGDKRVRYTIDRRVIILGDDHPSTKRIRGGRLARCDLAIVSINGHCWMVDVNPNQHQPNNSDSYNSESEVPEELVTYLTAGEAMVRGRLEIECLQPVSAVAMDQPVEPSLAEEVSKDLVGDINNQQTDTFDDLTVQDLDEELLADDNAATVVAERLHTHVRSRNWFKRFLLKTALWLLFLVALATIVWMVMFYILPILRV